MSYNGYNFKLVVAVAVAFWFALPVIAIDKKAGEQLTMVIKVNGAKPDKGNAILSVFTSKDNYMKEPVISETSAINGDGKASFEVKQLSAGTYAISVIYDEDSNGELNFGFLGVPSELIGFSNNARGTFGPPSFKNAMFDLQESKTITIELGKAK